MTVWLLICWPVSFQDYRPGDEATHLLNCTYIWYSLTEMNIVWEQSPQPTLWTCNMSYFISADNGWGFQRQGTRRYQRHLRTGWCVDRPFQHSFMRLHNTLVPRPSPSFPSLAIQLDGKLGESLGTRLAWHAIPQALWIMVLSTV